MDANSPYRIGYRREAGLLRAHVTGVNGSLETTLAYWNDLAGEVRRLPPRALLVVDDMEGDPPPPDVRCLRQTLYDIRKSGDDPFDRHQKRYEPRAV